MGIFDGLSPEFSDPLRKLMAQAQTEGISLNPVSGYRSAEDQQRAIRQVAQRNGIPFSPDLYSTGVPSMAAPVGRSQHQTGAAVDWDTSDPKTKEWLYANAPKHGFRFPLPNSDDGHMELGAAGRPSSPAAPSFTPQSQLSLPQSQGPQQMDDAQGWLPGLLGGIARGAQQTMLSPLFQSGLATYDAGARGQNWAGGLLAGGQAASAAAKHQQEIQKQQREQLAQMQRDQLWSKMSQGAPSWASDMPAGTVQMAQALGPDAGAKFLTDMFTKKSERQIERDKLGETSRYHDILTEQNRLRDEDLRGQRQSITDLNNERAAQMRHDAEREKSMFRAPPTAQPVAPPTRDSNIRPQSFEGQPDPNLIRTQAVDQPQPTPQPPLAKPQATIRVPKSERFPTGMATPDEAAGFAQELLSVDKHRPVGQQILKQIEQNRDDNGLDKSAKGEVEKTMVSQANHLARLQDIATNYGDNIAKYQNVKYRLGQAFNAQAEKFGGKLSPEQQREMMDYTQFRADSARNLNTLLKELSGAAVTQQEYERLLLTEPNAGQGNLFDIVNGDSPSQYVAKLQAASKGAKLAIARANFLRTSRGFSSEDIAKMAKSGAGEDVGGVSLPGMEKIMLREKNKIENEVRGKMPNAAEDDIRDQVRARMKGVFGI